jgi:hypothetical protein
MKKQKLKRKVRIKSLYPQHNTKVRKELLDADYLKDLDPETLKWYAQFTDEYVGGAVHKTKNGKVKSGHLHNTKALAKQCYDANNRRNIDIYAVTKANHLMSNIDDELSNNDGWYVANPGLDEDAQINNIDNPEENDAMPLEEYILLKSQMNEKRQHELEEIYVSWGHDIKFILDLHHLYEKENLKKTNIKKFINNPKLLKKFLENT